MHHKVRNSAVNRLVWRGRGAGSFKFGDGDRVHELRQRVSTRLVAARADTRARARGGVCDGHALVMPLRPAPAGCVIVRVTLLL